jgi:YbbR domain-containing protein
VVPFGVGVVRITPATIKLGLDRTSRRKVQVVTRVVGSPQAGYELVNIYLGSSEIEVSGPASRLSSLEQVTTEPVSVEGLREPYTATVQVMLDDPYARLVDARGVEVTLDVREERVSRELPGVAVRPDPPSETATFTPESVTVSIEGPRSVVEQLVAEDLEARANLDGLEPGVHQLAPEIVLLREEITDVEIVATEPAEVRTVVPSQGTRN